MLPKAVQHTGKPVHAAAIFRLAEQKPRCKSVQIRARKLAT